jgi:hypothetical protein
LWRCCNELGHVPLGPHDGAYRAGAAFGLHGVAAAERFESFVQLLPHGLYGRHGPGLLSQSQLSTVPET